MQQLPEMSKQVSVNDYIFISTLNGNTSNVQLFKVKSKFNVHLTFCNHISCVSSVCVCINAYY